MACRRFEVLGVDDDLDPKELSRIRGRAGVMMCLEFMQYAGC